MVTLAVKRENPPVDFGADLTVVLQPGVEYHPSVAISPPAGSDVFTLPADAAIWRSSWY